MGAYRRSSQQRSSGDGSVQRVLKVPVLLFLSVSLGAIALTAFLWPGPASDDVLSDSPSDVEEQRTQLHESQRRAAARGLRLLLASHGRLFWFQPDTNATTVLHEGQVRCRTWRARGVGWRRRWAGGNVRPPRSAQSTGCTIPHAHCVAGWQGVHYGVFPGERDAATGALRTLWFVLRPHNWHPSTAEEHLVQVDADTGACPRAARGVRWCGRQGRRTR